MIYVNIMEIFSHLRGRNLTVPGEFHFFIDIYLPAELFEFSYNLW